MYWDEMSNQRSNYAADQFQFIHFIWLENVGMGTLYQAHTTWSARAIFGTGFPNKDATAQLQFSFASETINDKMDDTYLLKYIRFSGSGDM